MRIAIENLKYTWNIEQKIVEAQLDGFEPIRSNSTRLLLDLDDNESLETYERVLPRLQEIFDIEETDRWLSKSGKHTHIILQCQPLSFDTRVIIQTALGSDPVRECLASLMHKDGFEEPSVLFKPPEGYIYETIAK